MSSNNRIVFEGLDELKAALRALPSELAAEASSIVVKTAEGAANTVRAEYGRHRVSGHLMNSVTVTQPGAGSYGVAMVVKVNDPIAWLFDNGSSTRQYYTVNGVRHVTGRMGEHTPPTHIFAGTMARSRRAMYGRLKELVERHGLIVTGTP